MKKIEIIGNKSIEEDLFDFFKKNNIVNYYTNLPIVHGVGKKGPKLGTSYWPEENFMLIIYCDDDEAKKIVEIVNEVKLYFRDEGLKLFEVNVEKSL